MFVLVLFRDYLLKYMPPNARVAEVGVAHGHFSAKILEHCAPKELHLIDPWIYQEDPKYQKDANNESMKEQENRYTEVLNRFQDPISKGQVKVHRQFSVEAAAQFPDEYFDWVYIDAKHTYEAVAEDLKTWAPKVKKDGIIFGDDFCKSPATDDQGYGVVEAVEEFVSRGEFSIEFLTVDGHPNYVLARKEAAPRISRMLAEIVLQFIAIEIPQYPKEMCFSQRLFFFPDGSNRACLGFPARPPQAARS